MITRYLFIYSFLQIENEYGSESKALGAPGHAYMTWAAKMAVGLGTGVPWVMCKEDDAPDPVVSGVFLFFLFLLAEESNISSSGAILTEETL